MPQSGTLEAWIPPDAVRVDSGVGAGQAITPHYDPLLAKLIAHGPDRETARRRLLRALEQTVAAGVITNRAFLCQALSHPDMLAGQVDTGFVQRRREDLAPPIPDPARLALVAAVLAGVDTMSARPGRSANRALKLTVDAGAGAESTEVDTVLDSDECRVRIVEREFAVRIIEVEDGRVCYEIDGRRRRAALVRDGDTIWMADEQGDLVVIDRSLAPPALAEAESGGRIEAPMDGTVIEVMTAVGEAVKRGDPVVVVEAMKMETTLRAGIDGVLGQLKVAAGDSVRKGQCLALIDAADDGSG
jgi:acetyl/propionyl-CoA carboxylase alpha subunit